MKRENKLFETKKAKGRLLYRLVAASILFSISLTCFYRVTHIPTDHQWLWFGLFVAEIWFGFYWLLTQALRWNIVHRSTFKDRLSHRYEKEFPRVDIFVCTADPVMEPPLMVINTVLSVMAYDYPPEKLSVYLSDDGGSDITYYAMLKASEFAKHWIPFCKKFNVQPRSPAAYFDSLGDSSDKELLDIKKLYQDMEKDIETVGKLGRIPEEVSSSNEGFSQWSSYSSRKDHDTILQILLDGRDSNPNARDIEGRPLPTLVYLAREKRPQYHHNFKAGAMNALIRVSSKISNGQIILNVDCDMYSNSSESILDALCFFMDEKEGHEIAYVQFPQKFENVTKNDIYGNSMQVITEVEFHGLDGYGGPLYIGTGCFHRRDTFCGKKFSKESKIELRNRENDTPTKDSLRDVEENLKSLASCTYEENNTQWGNEIGLKYGCPVEDVITGLSIQCSGWKSVYYNPEKDAFLGIAPTTLGQTLVQHKRWSEGDFQILLSKFSPAFYAHGKISFGLRLGYCHYCLWAPSSLAILFYTTIPSICLLKGISLFPQVTSPWIIPFVYATLVSSTYGLAEFLQSGGTILGWWNEQRIWLYKRTTSYFFAFIDTISKSLGFSNSQFVITAKVSDKDVENRYQNEIIEFGEGSSHMFTFLATIGLLNLICLAATIKRMIMDGEGGLRVFKTMGMQVFLCGIIVIVNWPLFGALFIRKDNGKMPTSLTLKSLVLATSICICVLCLY
ncbi:hypothetical protein ACFE04_021986 [Oxalis oulophora]